MTTYYGVWSDWSGRDGKQWWSIKDELFHTPRLGIAKAQAMVANAIWKAGPAYGTRKDEHWEARAIGEDGLPEEKLTWPRVTVEFAPELEARKCRICGETATHGRVTPDGEPLHYCTQHTEAIRIRSEAASHKCGICGDVATNWVELCGCKAYLCDQHEAWGSFSRSGRLFCVPKEKGS